MCCLVFKCWRFFYYNSIISIFYFLLWLGDINIFKKICWGLIYSAGYYLSVYMLNEHLKRYIFCSCWVECSVNGRLCWLLMTLYSCMSLLITYIVILTIVEKWMFKSLTKLWIFVFFFSSISFCFTYFIALLFDAYKSIVSWWIDSFVIV